MGPENPTSEPPQIAAPNQAGDDSAHDTLYPPRPQDDFATLNMPANTARSSARRFGTQPLPCLFGEYELVEEIARGGMGVVYKARQKVGAGVRMVALKMIQSAQLATPQAVERFLQEARAAAELDHPGIVPIHDVGEVFGQHYFTMTLLTGGSLADLVRNGPMPARMAARLLRLIAESVQHAHECGIIHRDIKPANILFAETRRRKAKAGDGAAGLDVVRIPKLGDFGLARTRESALSLTGDVLGTPSYMAPEQARGQKVTEATDVYGLGAVLYCVLTGRPPFQAADPMTTMQQVCTTEPTPPRKLNRKVPFDLETICLKCLEKDPAKRYESAVEFAEDLRRYERGEPVLARPVRRLGRCWRWCRRNPAVTALLLVLLLGGLALPVLVLRSGQWTAERQAAECKAQTVQIDLEDELARSRFETYVLQLRLAQVEIERGRHPDAQSLLNHCAPALRGWEHAHLARCASGRVCRALEAHKDGVLALAFSTDGNRIVTGGGDRAVKVWDATTGDLLQTLVGHTNSVQSVAYSGEHVFSAGREGAVKAWRPRAQTEAFALQGHADAVWSLALSPDGTRLLTGGADRTVKVWDARTGSPLNSLVAHTGPVTAVAWSPQGRRLASGSGDGKLKLWDASTGREALALPGHARRVNALAFSADGQRLASGSADGAVLVWDTATGQRVLQLAGHPGGVRSLAFALDGSRLVTGCEDGAVRVWETQRGRETLVLRAHGQSVRGVMFAPDGKRLASAGEDGTVRLWDIQDGPGR